MGNVNSRIRGYIKAVELELERSEQQRDELLAALENLMAVNFGGKKHCGHDFCCICAYDEAKAAIAKAKGGWHG